MEEAVLEEVALEEEAVLVGEDILEAAISEAEGGELMAAAILDTAFTAEDPTAVCITMTTMIGHIMAAHIMDTPLPIMAAPMLLADTPGAGMAGTGRRVMVIMGTADGTALDGQTGTTAPAILRQTTEV